MSESTTKSIATATRNQQHKNILICVYQYLFYMNSGVKPDIRGIVEETFHLPYADCDAFAKQALMQVVRHAQEAVNDIDPLLNQWKFERLGLIEQAILLMGYVYIKKLDFAPAIAIKIMVRLSQVFGESDSYRYINAVLEKV
jgi:N utilization substance protein B